MLVLTREVGQVIAINDDIQIVVVAIDHGIVRLGIDAPRDLPVHRCEIYKRLKARKV